MNRSFHSFPAFRHNNASYSAPAKTPLDFDANISTFAQVHLLILNDLRLQTLRILNIHSLDIAIQLLLGTLLIVSLSGDADAETERHALDAGFPDFLVELWV